MKKYFGVILLAVVLVAGLSGCDRIGDTLSFKSEYQAIFLDNGQVFFGKLENGGSAHPLLREVYYIGSQTSADGKEVQNILLKRGNEWHGPDYMVLTASHIVMVEPIAPTSRVAALIQELKSKQPTGQQTK